MKRQAVIMAAALFALTAAPVLGACDPTHPSDKDGQDVAAYFEAFESAPLSDPILVKACGGECRVRWADVAGAESYALYCAESKYGAYQKVGTYSAEEHEATVKEDGLYCYYKVCAAVDGEERELGRDSAFTPNTLIVSPFDDAETVQTEIDRLHAAVETGAEGQFSQQRTALLFLAGTYDVTARVGYYTSVNGLGEIPTDVSLQGVYVSPYVLPKYNTTCTFWRSVENVSVRSNVTWGVSQGTSFRRVKVDGSLGLSHGGWASGGFVANSAVTYEVSAGSQQQWFTRNTIAEGYTGGSFNMVFTGCNGDTAQDRWTADAGKVTALERTEKIAEKPFLYQTKEGAFSVFVPFCMENTLGVTWDGGHAQELGYDLPLSDFYIADARYDTADSINRALDGGKHLLLTPGNYLLDKPIEIARDHTVVLGLGYATLKIDGSNDDCALRVADVDGVRIADVLVDAGAYSKNMVVIGDEKSGNSHAADPTVLSDLYVRIGGAENVHTETDTAVAIYSNDVIGDNFWIWRADHSQGVAWNDETNGGVTNFGNPARTGVLVAGDRVRCYALMVEHFEQYQTLWTGEEGLTVMYQSETPYVVPSQSDWMSHDGAKRGYASYKVADTVEKHRAIGIGVYLVNPSGMTLDSAIEVPEKEGIEMYHLITCNLSGNSGCIGNVVNDYGGAVGVGGSGNRRVPTYPIKG